MIYVIGEKNQNLTLQLTEKALEISKALQNQSVSLLYVDAETIQLTYEITHYFQNIKPDYILLPLILLKNAQGIMQLLVKLFL